MQHCRTQIVGILKSTKFLKCTLPMLLKMFSALAISPFALASEEALQPNNMSSANAAESTGANTQTHLGSSTTWNKQGEIFPTYAFFRDELMVKMLHVKNRVALLSPFLGDADIATALFAARLRGIDVLALLGKQRTQEYNSRHAYLAKAQVPTFLLDLRNVSGDQQKSNEAVSLIVLDNETWAVNSVFHDTPPRSVFIKASSVTADEVFGWQNTKMAKRLFAEFGANKPTTSPSARILNSGNLKEYDNKEIGTSRIPRRLPKQTRMQTLRNDRPSAAVEGTTGSNKLPAPPPNEVDVTE